MFDDIPSLGALDPLLDLSNVRVGPNDHLKGQLSFYGYCLSPLALADLMGSTDCEINVQIVVIQY